MLQVTDTVGVSAGMISSSSSRNLEILGEGEEMTIIRSSKNLEVIQDAVVETHPGSHLGVEGEDAPGTAAAATAEATADPPPRTEEDTITDRLLLLLEDPSEIKETAEEVEVGQQQTKTEEKQGRKRSDKAMTSRSREAGKKQLREVVVVVQRGEDLLLARVIRR